MNVDDLTALNQGRGSHCAKLKAPVTPGPSPRFGRVSTMELLEAFLDPHLVLRCSTTLRTSFSRFVWSCLLALLVVFSPYTCNCNLQGIPSHSNADHSPPLRPVIRNPTTAPQDDSSVQVYKLLPGYSLLPSTYLQSYTICTNRVASPPGQYVVCRESSLKPYHTRMIRLLSLLTGYSSVTCPWKGFPVNTARTYHKSQPANKTHKTMYLLGLVIPTPHAGER